jgi:hypothetical protein
MKKLSLILLVLLTGCYKEVPSSFIEFANDRCSQNGGVEQMRSDFELGKYNKLFGSGLVLCKNGARFTMVIQ